MTWFEPYRIRIFFASVIGVVVSLAAVVALAQPRQPEKQPEFEPPTITVSPRNLQPDRAAGVYRVDLNPAQITGHAGAEVPVIGLRDVAVLLAKWAREGTIAGHGGDFYDNRDRDHSLIRAKRYPQLAHIQYAPALREKNLDYGVQLQLLFNRVVLGNSSTAMKGNMWRSNARRAYIQDRAMNVLHLQYTHNNLYVYPEHRDYDPGHNKIGGGYGDVFPANTPYVLISQGSSGSDRDFLDAVACTLAAFQPATKRRLVEHGMLMPTVQMIFRMCYDTVREESDYLLGKTHRPVYDGKKIHRRAMIQMAHDMQPDALPPRVRLGVVEESSAQPGVDYFEAGDTVKLATTPGAIARVHRQRDRVYRMVVSAGGSSDIDDRPLTYHWKVLQGDAASITIKPLNESGSLVEILVPYHHRFNIEPDSNMASNRVDIGAFVHNGVYYSAPAFVSISTLDDQTRVYDAQDRLIEIDHRAGVMSVQVKDGAGLQQHVTAPDFPEPLAWLHDALSAAPLEALDDAIHELLDDVTLSLHHAESLRKLSTLEGYEKAARLIERDRRALVDIGLIEPGEPDRLVSVRKGPEPVTERLTPYEIKRLKQMNLRILQQLLPEDLVQLRFRNNYVDPMIASRRNWRDVFDYAPDSDRLLGWTRYHTDGRVESFTAEGARVMETDKLGRPLRARTVQYGFKSDNVRRARQRTLLQKDGSMILHYGYDGPNDRTGRVIEREAME